MRRFLNPGYETSIGLQCTNCSANTRLALRPLANEHCATRGRVLHTAWAAAWAAVRMGEVPVNVIVDPPGNYLSSQILRARRSRQDKAAKTTTLLTAWTGLLCSIPEEGPCAGQIACVHGESASNQHHECQRLPSAFFRIAVVTAETIRKKPHVRNLCDPRPRAVGQGGMASNRASPQCSLPLCG